MALSMGSLSRRRQIVCAKGWSRNVAALTIPSHVINVSCRCVVLVGKQPNDSSAEAKSRVTGMGYMI